MSAATDTVGRRPLRVFMPTTWTLAFSPGRPVKHPTGAVGVPQRHRPRATAFMNMGNCVMSAAPGMFGCRRFLRGVSMLATWTSIVAESTRKIATTVRTAFSCVASRKREGPLGPGTKPPSPPSGPNPLGENQSLSSPPLEPRGLLLSVMRQKVGKDRSQGDYHPLG